MEWEVVAVIGTTVSVGIMCLTIIAVQYLNYKYYQAYADYEFYRRKKEGEGK